MVLAALESRAASTTAAGLKAAKLNELNKSKSDFSIVFSVYVCSFFLSALKRIPFFNFAFSFNWYANFPLFSHCGTQREKALN